MMRQYYELHCNCNEDKINIFLPKYPFANESFPLWPFRVEAAAGSGLAISRANVNSPCRSGISFHTESTHTEAHQWLF